VKVPLTAAGAEGEGDGDGVASGVAGDEGVAKGEAEGVGEVLLEFGVGGTLATGPKCCGVIL
jgi:hypothetical protein